MSPKREYNYADAHLNHAHAYLLPELEAILERFFEESSKPRRLFDLGSGNGSVANHLSALGYSVAGVDPSTEGIAVANTCFPRLELHVGSAYDALVDRFGKFPVVYSLEVVEHLYDPRTFAATVYSLTESRGMAIISTPYHGWLKNLTIVATGKFDRHFDPLWDHGHIKFWSRQKLQVLMEEAGFVSIQMKQLGRIPALAKSVMVCGYKR